MCVYLFIYRGQCTLINTGTFKNMDINVAGRKKPAICTHSPAKNKAITHKTVGIKIREKVEVMQYFVLMNLGKASLFVQQVSTATLHRLLKKHKYNLKL